MLIQWAPNKELDLSHYRIYRDAGSGYQLLADNITDTEYIDGDVVGQLTYGYKISAVDNDMNESVLSDESQSIAATFDAGILLVDDMNIYNPMPNQTVQDAFFQYLMEGTPFVQKSINDPATVLKRNEAGQYSSIFWIDDDLTPKLIEYSEDSISWYLNYTDNMFICGMRTVRYWSASDVPIIFFTPILKSAIKPRSVLPILPARPDITAGRRWRWIRPVSSGVNCRR